MGAEFDIRHVDLEAEQALLYLDRDNNVCLDREKGFLASVGRFFYSIVGMRDYRLDKIVTQAWNDISQGDNAQKNLMFLCGKVAKGCGIDDATYEKIILAEQLLKEPLTIPFSSENRSIAETFLQTLSESSSLQKQVGTFQAKLSSVSEGDNVQSVLKRAQLTRRWTDLGLDLATFNKDYEGAKFLIETRTIYQITGFQNSTQDGKAKHEIKIDPDGRVMIKKQGSYIPVTELAKEVEFDKERDEIKTIGKEEYWNYLSPDGLVPVDRWLHPEFVPVEQLSPAEMDKLRTHAKEFFPPGKEPSSDLPRDAVIQIFTNPRKEIPFEEFPLLSRLSASMPVHAAIRIITNDGKVYSTGFGADVEEYGYREKELLATVNGMPTILDFEEFRPHEGRIVTTVPITSKSCEKILETFQAYREKTLRFNLLKQNCVQMAANALDETGVKVNTVVTGPDLLGGATPSPEALPLIGELVGEIKRNIVDITKGEFGDLPRELLIGARLVQGVFLIAQSAQEVISYIPSKLGTLFCNMLVLTMGGTTGSPLPDDKGAGVEQDHALKRFGSVISNPLDLFKEDTSTLYHALPLIQWQLQQRTTAVHLYGKQPAMGILPPEPTTESDEKKRYFDKKYLTNFGIAT